MTRRRVIVLALDAASPQLLLEWAHDGSLPNLRTLMQRGLTGTIRGLDGYFIGATWPSFYTGVNPARHGFHYQTQLAPASYRLRDVADGAPTRQPPFWRRLGDAGRRVAILDVPLSMLDEEINGVQVVEWGVHDDLYGFGAAPAALQQTILDAFGRHLVGGTCDGVRSSAADYREFTRRLLESVDIKTRLTREIAAREPWDLLIQVFSESHCVGHQCWHLHDPAHPAHAALRTAAGDDPVKQVYQALDAAIGELARGCEDAALIVMSAHGMTHWYGAHFLLKDVFVALGVTVPLAGRSSAVAPASGFAQLAGRAWRTLPAGLREVLAPLRERLRPSAPSSPPTIAAGVDAAASRCFVVNNGLGTSGIRLNVAGREPSGLLQPGRDTDAFIDALTADLLSLTQAETGHALVRRVLRTDALYTGPALDVLPDLVVEWSREAAIGSALVGQGEGATVRIRHPRLGIIEGANRYGRTGEHEPDGLFVAVGPGIPQGTLAEAVTIFDFAPTICQLLDCPYESGDGAAIGGVVAAPWLS